MPGVNQEYGCGGTRIEHDVLGDRSARVVPFFPPPSLAGIIYRDSVGNARKHRNATDMLPTWLKSVTTCIMNSSLN